MAECMFTGLSLIKLQTITTSSIYILIAVLITVFVISTLLVIVFTTNNL